MTADRPSPLMGEDERWGCRPPGRGTVRQQADAPTPPTRPPPRPQGRGEEILRRPGLPARLTSGGQTRQRRVNLGRGLACGPLGRCGVIVKPLRRVVWTPRACCHLSWENWVTASADPPCPGLRAGIAGRSGRGGWHRGGSSHLYTRKPYLLPATRKGIERSIESGYAAAIRARLSSHSHLDDNWASLYLEFR
jgi:hypothetical protein